ncbi:MAG: 6-phosphofructokinase [Candidatus Omnitrophica bacterium]|nr:6-phosphofructokinase [Candidatus Omnitrophota bacterium]
MKRIGVLTGGGDCPGLNPTIRAVVRKAIHDNYDVVGIKNGWKGLIDQDTIHLDLNSISGILVKGGTILGTSRTNPFKDPKNVEKVKAHFKALKLYCLIAIGGEDTLGVANKLCKIGVPVVGIPKTIDNDLNATDFTFGFDTAVNIAMEAIDRLHTTAESHHRVMVVEVMGRHAGWIATYAGIAGGADMILIPEQPTALEDIVAVLKKRRQRGKTFSIVVAAEGAMLKDYSMVLKTEKKDAFGHVVLGGIGQLLAEKIEEATGYETRVTVLGHIQRGGSPTAFDRVLSTRFGIKAIELVNEKQFGKMVCLDGNQIKSVPLTKAVGKLKTVDMDFFNMARIFFG